MKLYALLVFNNFHQLEYSNYNLSEFFFIYRTKIKEGIESVAIELIKNAKTNNFYKINEKFQDVEMSIYLLSNDKIYIVLTDNEYPQRVVFTLLHSIKNANVVQKDTLFESYQNPDKHDKITQIKNELEETKIIMFDSIDKLMERGENLNELLQRAENLSETSFLFVDKTKDMNRCCVIL